MRGQKEVRKRSKEAGRTGACSFLATFFFLRDRFLAMVS
jgi:hypothetical protein